MSRVRIGSCGFRFKREDYMRLLSTVEVQHTFYQPPQISTLKNWRTVAPAGFQFTLKAWQLITHKSASPTYRRLKRKLTDLEKEEVGSFKPTTVVKEAWQVTLECAKALKAKKVLFQCPASFESTKANISNMERFFASVDRGKLGFCWEPRGEWNRDIVKGLCKDLDLWHVVDPFVTRTVTPSKCYYRLHGRKGWRYVYEEDELEELATLLPENKSAYVFFNNVSMINDAVRFEAILQAGMQERDI